jgi:hypothetical protein
MSEHTKDPVEAIIIDSPSISDAEFPSDSYSSSSINAPCPIISGGGLVLSGSATFMRSRGPFSVADEGLSSGNSMLLSPVIVL